MKSVKETKSMKILWMQQFALINDVDAGDVYSLDKTANVIIRTLKFPFIASKRKIEESKVIKLSASKEDLMSGDDDEHEDKVDASSGFITKEIVGVGKGRVEKC